MFPGFAQNSSSHSLDHLYIHVSIKNNFHVFKSPCYINIDEFDLKLLVPMLVQAMGKFS